MKKLKQIFCALLVTVFGVALLSACGNTKTSKTDEWQEISFEELNIAYEAKEPTPWNHLEGTVVDGMVNETYFIVEDLIDGVWVVDETKSTPNRTGDWQKLSNAMVTSDEEMQTMNPINASEQSWTYKFYKKGDQYKTVATHVYDKNNGSPEMIMDKYFCMTYMTYGALDDAQNVIVNVTWSVK